MATAVTTPRKLWQHPDPTSTDMWKFMQASNQKRGLNMQVRSCLFPNPFSSDKELVFHPLVVFFARVSQRPASMTCHFGSDEKNFGRRHERNGRFHHVCLCRGSMRVRTRDANAENRRFANCTSGASVRDGPSFGRTCGMPVG